MTAALADLRHTVEQLERRFAGLEGRLDSLNGRLFSSEERVTKLTDLTKHVLEFSGDQLAELRRSLDANEEHLKSIRATIDVTAEQNGRILRQLAELQK